LLGSGIGTGEVQESEEYRIPEKIVWSSERQEDKSMGDMGNL